MIFGNAQAANCRRLATSALNHWLSTKRWSDKGHRPSPPQGPAHAHLRRVPAAKTSWKPSPWLRSGVLALREGGKRSDFDALRRVPTSWHRLVGQRTSRYAGAAAEQSCRYDRARPRRQFADAVAQREGVVEGRGELDRTKVHQCRRLLAPAPLRTTLCELRPSLSVRGRTSAQARQTVF
jgi:hypothetical protein